MARAVTRPSGILSFLTRVGMRRGLFDGSKGWLYVGLAATALRVVRRVITEQEVVETIELKPGEAIEIRTVRR